MECPVCYETVNTNIVQKLECNHSLCKICLDRLRTPCCPLCRANITIVCRRNLLPVDNSTEDVEFVSFDEETQTYELEFSIEIQLPSFVHRSRRRRSGTGNRIEQDLNVPTVVSRQDLLELMSEDTIVDNIYNISMDCNKQKARQIRNRWRNSNYHDRRGIRRI